MITMRCSAVKEDSETPNFLFAAYNRFPLNYEMLPSSALLVCMAAHLFEETPSGAAARMLVVNAFLRATSDVFVLTVLLFC